MKYGNKEALAMTEQHRQRLLVARVFAELFVEKGIYE